MRRFGLSFSWRRALGLSAAKGRLARRLGVPLTRAGRERKVGRLLGCCVVLVALLGTAAAVAVAAVVSGR